MRLDGANTWEEFWFITLPQLGPFLTTIMLFEVIWTFNRFDIIWLFTQGGPANLTQTLATTVYQDVFQTFNFGEGAALGTIMFLCLVIIIFPLVRMAERAAQSGV